LGIVVIGRENVSWRFYTAESSQITFIEATNARHESSRKSATGDIAIQADKTGSDRDYEHRR
jgi:hypothetical protein